jgi:hypothetical protein
LLVVGSQITVISVESLRGIGMINEQKKLYPNIAGAFICRSSENVIPAELAGWRGG